MWLTLIFHHLPGRWLLCFPTIDASMQRLLLLCCLA